MSFENDHINESILPLEKEREIIEDTEIKEKKTLPIKINLLGQPKWLLMLIAIGIFSGIIIIWRAVSISPNASENAQNTATTNDVEKARLSVRTVPVNLETIRHWVYADGFVTATTKKHLTFQGQGTIEYIKKVNGRDLAEGDQVKQGELLARIDARQYNADITVASAGQIEAKNQVINAVANLRQAEQSLSQAEAELQKTITDQEFALSDLKRYQQLAQEGAVQRREVDVRKTNYKNAQSSVSAAQARVSSAQAQVAAANTQVKTASAGVESATARLKQSNVKREDTEIVAPFNGIISRLNIREGDYWTPQRVNAGGDYEEIVDRLPIIMINPNRYKVMTDLPAFQGEKVRPGNRAFIILDSDRSQANSEMITGEQMMALASASGEVLSVSPSVSPGDRSVRVTIQITQGAEKLKDGQQIFTWIATKEKNEAKVAPFSAFISRGENFHVFVVNESEGIVEQRTIQSGIEGLSKREILTGVEVGEKLVTTGKRRLVDGTPVKIISD